MNLKELQDVVKNSVAIRFELQLQPPGGPEQKIFPPTYPSSNNGRPTYAFEERLIRGQKERAVLLDSVPSQANRLEQALLNAYRQGLIPLPIIQVHIEGHGIITHLDAPHRVFDAIFLDSLHNGVPYFNSPLGKSFSASSLNNATALFTYAPTTLLFGAWDSHSGRRVGAAKFPRAVTSEIIGWGNVSQGTKTSSRIDPLGIMNMHDLYQAEMGRWTYDPDKAAKNKQGKPVLVKPSAVGHGNIPPSLESETGGISVLHCQQTAVLSLVQLRLMHFPYDDGSIDETRDVAARTVLAALALCALAEQYEQGYQLRSGCLLQPVSEPEWIIDGKTATEKINLEMEPSKARMLLKDAVKAAEECGLKWPEKPIELEPSPELAELVRRNRELVTVPDEEE